MTDNENRMTDHIAEFYDEFKTQQTETGVNLRHYLVFDHLRKAGLKPYHKVFEIGCGIGTFTQLMSSFITKGKIVATDISSQSIGIAKSNPKLAGKVEFLVSDMREFSYPEKFDFVVMIDVLEHIPFEQYDQLFRIISQQLSDEGRLAINIPHPDIIEYLRKHSPEKLQIIDNSVKMDYLAEKAYKNQLKLSNYLPYSIFHTEEDYVFAIFKKENINTSFTPLKKIKIQSRKLTFRVKYILSRMISS